MFAESFWKKFIFWLFNRFGVFPVCVISIFSDVDEYGFKRDATFNPKIYENFTSSYYSVLTKRRMKWQAYMKKPHILQNNKSAKLKRYVRKGIPGNVFGIAFNAVCVCCVCGVFMQARRHTFQPGMCGVRAHVARHLCTLSFLWRAILFYIYYFRKRVLSACFICIGNTGMCET